MKRDRKEGQKGRMAAADRAEELELKSIAALWSKRADYWRMRAEEARAVLDRYRQQGAFSRLSLWAKALSPVPELRSIVNKCMTEAAYADAEAVRISAIFPEAGRVLREIERINRVLERARRENIIIDPIWPDVRPLPDPPPPLDDFEEPVARPS
jgi:hypothetical protein